MNVWVKFKMNTLSNYEFKKPELLFKKMMISSNSKGIVTSSNLLIIDENYQTKNTRSYPLVI